MKKSILFVLVNALLASGAWASQPGENTQGSTTVSISDDLAGADVCITYMPANMLDNEVVANTDVSASAFALAMSAAQSYIDVSYSGDVTVDLTRHGNNGAVHQVELNAAMGSGTLFAQTAWADAGANSYGWAYTSEEAEAAAQMIGSALAILAVGVDESGDFLGIDITVKAIAKAELQTIAEAEASSESSAESEASADAGAVSGAESSAQGAGISLNGSTFYVQGANIEKFDTQLSVASGTIVNVQTDALAQVYASAIAYSMVHAMAEASAEATSLGKLSFEYDLPLIGSGTLPIATASDSAFDVANAIMSSAKDIAAYSQAQASSFASTVSGSSVSMDLGVHFENLPGTQDLLEITGTGNLTLDCSNVLSGANAQATATVN